MSQVVLKKNQNFADELLINPTPSRDALSKLSVLRGIDLQDLKKCLNEKANLLDQSREPIQKPKDIGDLADFRGRIRKDIKEVGTDGAIGYLEQLVDGFAFLASIRNVRVRSHVTDETVESLELKISYLDYKVRIVKDAKTLRDFDIITSMISQIESLEVDVKKPRLERATSNASSSSVEEEVSFWGFGK